jgi:nicotinamidase-related amidase
MPVTALDPRSALVVIDLQKGIAAFPTVHPMAGVIAATVKLAAAFRRAQLPVVLVTVGPSADGGGMVRTRTEAPARVRTFGPDFAQLVPELAGHASDLLVTKRNPSAFYGTELDLQLRRRHVTNLVLTGVSTSSGVEATARAAHERAYNLTFATDAITDIDPEAHDFVLRKTFPKLGELGTADEILELLP